MECPIKLNKIHCQNCSFTRQGKCRYEEIVKPDLRTEKELADLNAMREVDYRR